MALTRVTQTLKRTGDAKAADKRVRARAALQLCYSAPALMHTFAQCAGAGAAEAREGGGARRQEAFLPQEMYGLRHTLAAPRCALWLTRASSWLASAAAAKKEDLVAKFAELKARLARLLIHVHACVLTHASSAQASGRLEAFMAKRRAKLASKDHVFMPHERRGGAE